MTAAPHTSRHAYPGSTRILLQPLSTSEPLTTAWAVVQEQVRRKLFRQAIEIDRPSQRKKERVRPTWLQRLPTNPPYRNHIIAL